ncbi:arylsulfatase [Sinomicrobium soli]|uniref:arylsulfatase n=1 Tax=Sinomicrobium sp. N-1-3-6 TaxID=2219864 RepID=UPI000DCBAAE5|nr:arylsulfatase [Sinomicrobium sp. N-1-3-6]RAV30263.1 arylsulfatase [Sinomicrobium sp. N-1-3-6]
MIKSLKRGILTVLLLAVYGLAAQEKRPNIILIMADDMGYSDLGCYGGEVDTPNIDMLASNGIRYRQFYNAARCCPTRAALMTGLYPHQAGMGWMAAADMGTPEYQGDLNNTSVTIAEVLKTAGYKTYMSGKWHLTNDRKTRGGVKDNWPRQRGFDRYFGIVPGGANYFTPVIYSNNTRYKAPDGFYLTDAISDTSVVYLKDHFKTGKDTPFFMYVAYTAPHWPLHAPEKEIGKYRDVYTAGWDSIRKLRFQKQKELGLFPGTATLNPRDPGVPAWDDEPESTREEMAMRMAIYAAQIDIMDQGIGRIVKALKENGALDNTLILFLSDNGACAEYISSGKSKSADGTADTFESYRIHWANVSSTPFKEYKHYTYEGGIATPFIVHWPQKTDGRLNNSFAKDYGHIIDVMATCVDVAGAKYPEVYKGKRITPMQGKSLLPNIEGKSRPRGKIFWEHEANIALRDGRWKMVAKTASDHKFSKSALRLYDLEADPAETRDLSSRYPERLEQMYKSWQAWGEEINVFPLNTHTYNDRMKTYRRMINGGFDANLGDWKIRKQKSVRARITTDHSGQISGERAAKIHMDVPGKSFSDLSMSWRFPARAGERLAIKLKCKGNTGTAFLLKLEKLKGENTEIAGREIAVTPEVGMRSMTVPAIPETGDYRLVLYLGDLKRDTTVWIDDIEIEPVY